MERDALLSHGAAFLLHDRLMNCSDRHVARVCSTCGSLLSTSAHRSAVATVGQSAAAVAGGERRGSGGVKLDASRARLVMERAGAAGIPPELG